MTDKEIKDKGKADYQAWRKQMDIVKKLKQDRQYSLSQWTSKVEEGI